MSENFGDYSHIMYLDLYGFLPFMGFSLGFEQQENSESESILPRVPINLIAKWAREETEGRPLQAEVAVIPEPLKARIITYRVKRLPTTQQCPSKRTLGGIWLPRRNFA